ncbi:MAG TPA: CsgG/HfaB family protein [Leptospiraceae bacterium]|nr:CsgG/HfaB family protein [Leptospiraceae bacterium]
MKIISLLALFLLHCSLHSYKLNGEEIRTKRVAPNELSVNYDIHRKTPANENDELTRGYNKESLYNIIERSCCIRRSPNSNIIMKYETDVKGELRYPLTVFFWMATLGIIPVFEEAIATVTVTLEKKDTGEIINQFTYRIDEYVIHSWLTIPFGLTLSGSESHSLSFLHSEYPMEFITDRLAYDLLRGGSRPALTENKTPPSLTPASSKVAVLPFNYKFKKHEHLSETLRDKVETLLVNKKYTVLDRMNLKQILKEMKLSQTGLTIADQIKIGKMMNATNLITGEILETNDKDDISEFSVKNIDIQTGKIIWKHEFQISENSSSSLNSAIQELGNRI